MIVRSRAAIAAAFVLLLAGCAPTGSRGPVVPAASQSIAGGTVVVFAAASLAETFGAMAAEFEVRHPGVKIALNFGGSSALAVQIVEGAPAAVFAAASDATMATVTQAGRAAEAPVTFATNTLEIAVPPANPGRVTGLPDFARPGLAIAVCAVEVPCGAAARTVFAAAGITPSIDTLEQDVKAVLTKVELGEVDAGLVYRTDVRAAGVAVTGIDFPRAAAAVSRYRIARLTSSNPAAAAFVAFVLSPAGASILTKAGFGAP